MKISVKSAIIFVCTCLFCLLFSGAVFAAKPDETKPAQVTTKVIFSPSDQFWDGAYTKSPPEAVSVNLYDEKNESHIIFDKYERWRKTFVGSLTTDKDAPITIHVAIYTSSNSRMEYTNKIIKNDGIDKHLRIEDFLK